MGRIVRRSSSSFKFCLATNNILDERVGFEDTDIYSPRFPPFVDDFWLDLVHQTEDVPHGDECDDDRDRQNYVADDPTLRGLRARV
jgi:hypothetical protein